MDIGARGHHAAAGIEHGNNAGNTSVAGGRGQSDHRLAELGASRATNEIHLPAKAAIKALAHRIGAHLPREVDLHRRIDGDHVIVPCNHERIVHIAVRTKLKHRVFVDELVKPLVPSPNPTTTLYG